MNTAIESVAKVKVIGRMVCLDNAGNFSERLGVPISEIRFMMSRTGARQLEEGIYGAYIRGTRFFFEFYRDCPVCGGILTGENNAC